MNRPTLADRLRDPEAHGFEPTRDDLAPPAAWVQAWADQGGDLLARFAAEVDDARKDRP